MAYYRKRVRTGRKYKKYGKLTVWSGPKSTRNVQAAKVKRSLGLQNSSRPDSVYANQVFRLVGTIQNKSMIVIGATESTAATTGCAGIGLNLFNLIYTSGQYAN